MLDSLLVCFIIPQNVGTGYVRARESKRFQIIMSNDDMVLA